MDVDADGIDRKRNRMLLATSSKSIIRTWDIQKQVSTSENVDNTTVKECIQFEPHANGNTSNTTPIVTDFAWNHNGQVIASCGTSTPTEGSNASCSDFVLSHAGTGSKFDQSGSMPSLNDNETIEAQQPSSISFGGKSRYLCVSSLKGYIPIYNLKKKTRVRLFRYTSMKGMMAVQQACFDPSNTYIAAISCDVEDDSSVRLFALRGDDVREQKAKEYYEVFRNPGLRGGSATTMAFSPLESNILAVGSSSNNAITLYDITSSSSSNVISFLQDKSPNIHSCNSITSISFSSIHKLLLCASSTDGTINFHDTHSKKTIQTIHPQQEIATAVTSMDMHMDGITLACTTNRNRLLLYDLRNTSTPFFQALLDGDRDGDCSPIVKFYSKSAPSSYSSHKPRHTNPSTPLPPTDTTSATTPFIPSSHDSNTPLSTTSPPRQIATDDTLYQNTTTTPISNHMDVSFIPNDDQDYTHAPLSPSNQLSTTEPPLLDHDYDTTTTPSVTTLKQESSFILPRETDASSFHTDIMNEDDDMHPPENYHPLPTTNENDLSSLRTTTAIHMDEDNDCIITSQTSSDDNEHDDASNYNNPTSPNIPNTSDSITLNKIILKQIVNEQMQNIQENLQQSIQNLHIDMIRQFYIQSKDIQLLMEQQNKKLELILEENEALKEENDYLRNI